MVVVDYLAGILRDNWTTYSGWLSLGTTTTESINVTSTTINDVISTVQRQSISYPSNKKFTAEYLLDANSGNGVVLRRIGIKQTSTTTNVITLSNIPEIDKNNLIEVAIEVTLEVDNE